MSQVRDPAGPSHQPPPLTRAAGGPTNKPRYLALFLPGVTRETDDLSALGGNMPLPGKKSLGLGNHSLEEWQPLMFAVNDTIDTLEEAVP